MSDFKLFGIIDFLAHFSHDARAVKSICLGNTSDHDITLCEMRKLFGFIKSSITSKRQKGSSRIIRNPRF